MKKVFLNFADRLLTKEQMKNVTGGDWFDDYMANITACHTCEGGTNNHNPPPRPSVQGGGQCLDWTIKTDSLGNEYWSSSPCGTPPYH